MIAIFLRHMLHFMSPKEIKKNISIVHVFSKKRCLVRVAQFLSNYIRALLEYVIKLTISMPFLNLVRQFL